MRFVIQRVGEAHVAIEGRPAVSIGRGLVVFIGIHRNDTEKECAGWVDKILKLRVFPDQAKPINRSIQDVGGEVLLISQFTLYGDCKGQNRPSFIEAAKPEEARRIYNHFVDLLKQAWPKTKTGEFAADMKVSLTNDGPVTIILE